MAAISSTKGDLLARTRIMFVCLGNICRSPTAEYVCRAQAKARSVLVELSSSGTGNWHSGDSAHPPMVTAAAKKGYDLSPHSAQQVTAEHLKQNDFIVCMDNSNLANVYKMFPRLSKHLEESGRLFTFCSKSSVLKDRGISETPDPYYTNTYTEVVEIVEIGSSAILDFVSTRTVATDKD